MNENKKIICKNGNVFRPAKRCACCGKLQKATVHLYDGKCKKCYSKSLVGKTTIVGGRSGVTNTQLLAAIKANINDQAILIGLKGNYPNMFENAFRYLKSGERAVIKKLFPEIDEMPAEKLALIARIKPKRSGVSGERILAAMHEALALDDGNYLAGLWKFWPEIVRNQLRYLRSADRAIVEEFIGERVG